MPLARGRSVRFGGLLHRDSIEAGSFGSRPRTLSSATAADRAVAPRGSRAAARRRLRPCPAARVRRADIRTSEPAFPRRSVRHASKAATERAPGTLPPLGCTPSERSMPRLHRRVRRADVRTTEAAFPRRSVRHASRAATELAPGSLPPLGCARSGRPQPAVLTELRRWAPLHPPSRGVARTLPVRPAGWRRCAPVRCG
jgi:hypothetical protein